MSQQALVRGVPRGHGALEIRQIFLGNVGGLVLVAHQNIDDAVGHLGGHRANFLGGVDAQATALDHRWAAHAQGRALGRDDHVAARHQRGVAGETSSVDHGDQRHQPAQLRERCERMGVHGDAGADVIFAGPSAAALAVQHQRKFEPLRQFEHAILLVVVAVSLGAGEHGVIVVHQCRPRSCLVEQIAVNGAHARDYPVPGGVFPQRLDTVAPMLPGHDQRPVFFERSGIHQPVDILARHAVAEFPATSDGVRAVFVQAEGVSVVGFLEVAADKVRVEGAFGGDGSAGDLGLLDKDDGVAFADHVAGGHGNAADDAGVGGGNQVLHLHGFDDGELLAPAHGLADRDIDGDDGTLDGGGYSARAVRRYVVHLGDRPVGLHLGVVGEQRQGVAAFDPRAGEPGIGCGGAGWFDEALPLCPANRQRGHVFIHPARVDGPGGEVGMRQDVTQERNIGADALQPEFAQGPRRSSQGGREVGCVDDDLGQQRVERAGGAVPRVAEPIRPHPRSVWGFVDRQGPAARAHRPVRSDRLHVHPGLDGEAARFDAFVQPEVSQRRALRQPDLGLHEVHTGHGLGHGMLDLQPGIGFDEHEWLRAGGIEQELERPEVGVFDALREPHRGVDQLPAQVVVQSGGRGDFHDLLEAALDAALPLPQMRDSSGTVADDLHFDMPSTGDEFFDVDLGAAEGGGGFRLAAGEGGIEFARRQHRPRAAPAAPGQGLDNHRPARTQGGEKRLGFGQRDGMVQAPNDRHAGRDRCLPSTGLVAEQVQMADVRADEGQAGIGAGLREIGAFCQEPVAGMDGGAAGVLGRGDDGVRIQIDRRPLAGQLSGLIGDAQMQTSRIIVPEHCHRWYPQIRRRPGDANGDLAAVGDQQLLFHSRVPPGIPPLRLYWSIARDRDLHRTRLGRTTALPRAGLQIHPAAQPVQAVDQAAADDFRNYRPGLRA